MAGNRNENQRKKHQERKRARRQMLELLRRDGHLCSLCGKPMKFQSNRTGEYDPDAVSVDHIVPLAQGGRGNPENLRLAHVKCNQKRDRVNWTRDGNPTCKNCGAELELNQKRRSCAKCRQAFCFIWAGVGLA